MGLSSHDQEHPVRGTGGLREIVPPPSLVPGVMRRLSDPEPMSLWAWLWRRRRFHLSFSPLGVVMVVVTAAVGGYVLSTSTAHLPRVPFVGRDPLRVSVPAEQGETTVLVRFVLVAAGAKKVALAGDFNGWDTERTLLEKQDASGTFSVTVRLPRGQHQYMFVVDGEWVTDPQATERRPDGFGRENAIIRL